jgi:hypothetical protein
MKTFIIIIILIYAVSSIIVFSILITNTYIKKDSKFGKWWDKKICHELDPNDPNF